MYCTWYWMWKLLLYWRVCYLKNGLLQEIWGLLGSPVITVHIQQNLWLLYRKLRVLTRIQLAAHELKGSPRENWRESNCIRPERSACFAAPLYIYRHPNDDTLLPFFIFMLFVLNLKLISTLKYEKSAMITCKVRKLRKIHITQEKINLIEHKLSLPHVLDTCHGSPYTSHVLDMCSITLDRVDIICFATSSRLSVSLGASHQNYSLGFFSPSIKSIATSLYIVGLMASCKFMLSSLTHCRN